MVVWPVYQYMKQNLTVVEIIILISGKNWTGMVMEDLIPQQIVFNLNKNKNEKDININGFLFFF